MSTAIRLLDVVALTEDLPQHGLHRGEIGTVVEAFDEGVFEVEFSDDDGRTYACLPLRAELLAPLHDEPTTVGGATDTVEGTLDEALWYHYDITNDVLYMRLASQRGAETVAEETPEGFILVRRADDNSPVGMTIVNWWKRFYEGPPPASVEQIEPYVEAWKDKIAA